MIPSNWTTSKNIGHEYPLEYKIYSIQQGKIYNIWHPVKGYKAYKEAGKYDPKWGGKSKSRLKRLTLHFVLLWPYSAGFSFPSLWKLVEIFFVTWYMANFEDVL